MQSAEQFLAVDDPPIAYLMGELIPEGVLVLLHGEPRTRKSWAALELAIAIATGTPAFGLSRFGVSKPTSILYCSQEDDSRRVRERLRRLFRGRGVQKAPKGLAVAVHAGIDLKEPEWQTILLRDIKSLFIKAIIFDPIRRFALDVDKGPAEVREVTGFLRRLIVETGCTVIVVHHDTKPPKEGSDQRRRGHRASGGDWFAASDCPIAFEAAGARSYVYPEDFKFSGDPGPFVFTLEDGADRSGVRLVGEDVAAGDAALLVLHERLLAYLRANPRSSVNAIVRGLRPVGKGSVIAALEALADLGKVDSVQHGPRRAAEWWVTP
jgi:hypothetical protein